MGRGTSLCLRPEAVRNPVEEVYAWPLPPVLAAHGFVGWNVGAWASLPEPLVPGMGKWLKLGSAMMLL